jgi:hypothetical protein
MLRPPTSLRETVLLFSEWRPKLGVAGLFARTNWSRASRRQLIHAFLDRPPATAAEAADGPGFDAGAFAMELFNSAEFRNGLALRLLHCFPGKRRVLFVHLPKCAGTDFTAAMRGAFPNVHKDWDSTELVPQPVLERRLHHFGRLIQTEKFIFMGGHLAMGWFLDQNLYRYTDRMVAIVRPPHEICVSFINYVIARFRITPDLSTPDTRAWASKIGLTSYDAASIDEKALALTLVTMPNMQPVNPICSLLGEGTAASAFGNMTRASIELTSVDRYSAWLKESWNIDREIRENVSAPVITWSDLSSQQQAQIEAGCAEDRIVYEAVMGCLARSGGLSVTGPEVVAGLR